MRRAYNYFFGGPAAPPSPSTPPPASTTPAGEPKSPETPKHDEQAAREAPDTPPETPAAETHPRSVEAGTSYENCPASPKKTQGNQDCTVLELIPPRIFTPR